MARSSGYQQSNISQGRRIARFFAIPYALFMAFVMMFVAAGFLLAFARFWHFMVLESKERFEGWGVVKSFIGLLEQSFPMTETNGIRFEFKLEQILILANVIAVMYMCHPPTTQDIVGQPPKKGKDGKSPKAKKMTFHRAE